MNFLKTTVIGGILFLVPFIALVAVIGKALEITSKLATPITERLPADTVAGPIMVHLVAAGILVAICFLAGVAAKTKAASKLVDSLETNILSRFPPYAFLKTKARSMLTPDDTAGMTAVIARFDDSWQIAFEIERVEDDKVAIFLPGAPDPWSGSISVVTADRVAPLDQPVPVAADWAEALGKGTNDLVSGRLPAEKAAA